LAKSALLRGEHDPLLLAEGSGAYRTRGLDLPARSGEVLPLSSVNLRVPLSDAIAWGDWLTDALSDAADASNIGYDGGEEEGEVETHLFLNADAQTVKTVVDRVLRDRRLDRDVCISGAAEVVVNSVVSSDWISATTPPGRYAKETSVLLRQLNVRDDLRSWLHAAGYKHFSIRQIAGGPALDYASFMSPPDGIEGELFMIAQVDLSVCDRRGASRAAVQQAARGNLYEILSKLSAFVGASLPQLPELTK